MGAKLLILAALVACANAGFLSVGYGNNGNGQAGGNGGYLAGSNAGNPGYNGAGNSNSNYYNNAPLALSHGPLPQSNPQPVVAPLRYAPNPPPLATSASFRQQISHSQPAQLQVSSYGNLGNLGGYSSGLGGVGLGNGNNNAGYNNGYAGYGLNGVNANGNNGNNYGSYGNRGY